MSRMKLCQQKQPVRSLRTISHAVTAICLVLGAMLAAAYWKPSSSSSKLATTATGPVPQATPTPLILSKEYIYAGDKLIASEVPTTEQALIEGDVSPRPNGNGRLTVADWVQTGRFTAGLDTVSSGSEFQRTDCAPRSVLGGGTISISDWVQAGRYAAGLDPPTYLGGPIASSRYGSGDGFFFAFAFPISLSHLTSSRALTGYLWTKPTAPVTTRTVRIVSPTFVVGQNGTVIVELDSQGDESGLGLSLSFSTSQLTFVSAVKGTDATNATLNVNSSGAGIGSVGLAVTQPSGQVFASGTRQVVVVTFSPAVNGSVVVASTNQPVWKEVVDVNGNTLATTFTP